jgi:hypothetical protein
MGTRGVECDKRGDSLPDPRNAAQQGHPADAPARALKIVGILTNAFVIYRCGSRRGAADAQAVRRLL